MKNALLSLALLATLSTMTLAGDVKKKGKVTARAKAKTECPAGTSHSCCMKRAQA